MYSFGSNEEQTVHSANRLKEHTVPPLARVPTVGTKDALPSRQLPKSNIPGPDCGKDLSYTHRFSSPAHSREEVRAKGAFSAAQSSKDGTLGSYAYPAPVSSMHVQKGMSRQALAGDLARPPGACS